METLKQFLLDVGDDLLDAFPFLVECALAGAVGGCIVALLTHLWGW